MGNRESEKQLPDRGSGSSIPYSPFPIPDMKKAMEIAQQLVDKKTAVQQPLKKGKK